MRRAAAPKFGQMPPVSQSPSAANRSCACGSTRGSSAMPTARTLNRASRWTNALGCAPSPGVCAAELAHLDQDLRRGRARTGQLEKPRHRLVREVAQQHRRIGDRHRVDRVGVHRVDGGVRLQRGVVQDHRSHRPHLVQQPRALGSSPTQRNRTAIVIRPASGGGNARRPRAAGRSRRTSWPARAGPPTRCASGRSPRGMSAPSKYSAPP